MTIQTIDGPVTCYSRICVDAANRKEKEAMDARMRQESQERQLEEQHQEEIRKTELAAERKKKNDELKARFPCKYPHINGPVMGYMMGIWDLNDNNSQELADQIQVDPLRCNAYACAGYSYIFGNPVEIISIDRNPNLVDIFVNIPLEYGISKRIIVATKPEYLYCP